MSVLKLRPAAAFYDSKECTPILPVLSSQVEIAYWPMSHVWVSTCEEMTLTKLDVLLQVRPLGREKSVIIDILHSDSEHSESSPAFSELSLSSLASKQGTDNKIPKPSGEAGRPRQEDYNLEDQLSWGQFAYKAAKEHLDTTKCQSLQDHKAWDTMCELVMTKFLDLDTFQNCWPILDLIQMHLKYLSLSPWQKKRSSSKVEKEEKRRERSCSSPLKKSKTSGSSKK
ncbi:hypothetical protein V8B97DRAFT_2026594 [Scleroderma yunnanense]